MANVRETITKWDQDPLVKLVGLVVSTTVPVCIAAIGLTWKLSGEAESIRNKIDRVAAEHSKLEARVDELDKRHNDLRVEMARCCNKQPLSGKPGLSTWGALWTDKLSSSEHAPQSELATTSSRVADGLQ